jgi:hypothetical protein
MESRVGRRSPGTRAWSPEPAADGWLPPLTDLAFALPLRTARALIVLLQPGAARPGPRGFGVPPMSEDWLQQRMSDSGKRGDPL